MSGPGGIQFRSLPLSSAWFYLAYVCMYREREVCVYIYIRIYPQTRAHPRQVSLCLFLSNPDASVKASCPPALWTRCTTKFRTGLNKLGRRRPYNFSATKYKNKMKKEGQKKMRENGNKKKTSERGVCLFGRHGYSVRIVGALTLACSHALSVIREISRSCQCETGFFFLSLWCSFFVASFTVKFSCRGR